MTAQRVWSFASVVGKLGPSIGARHKDAGKHERKTPTPYRQAEREKQEICKFRSAKVQALMVCRV